ncbi:hypothetical protein [Photobacterium sp. MCCC 1A19761]|uniref:hypothetical protein n=1 Tax=Photobacterium sp. MCCC 1A19761 TaxID=3115000 RepID=UPI00307F83E1
MGRMTPGIRAAAISLTLVAATAQAEPQVYSLDELQQLARQQAWTEVITHLQDVSPAERGVTWQALVDQAGVAFLKSLTATVSLEDVVGVGKGLTLQYPQLVNNGEFTAIYLAQAEQYYAPCYRYGNAACTHEYAQTLTHFSAPADMLFQQGQRALKQVSSTASVPFFAPAVQRNAAYCQEADVAKGVLETLALPKHQHYQAALAVATQHCRDHKLTGADGYLKHSSEVQEALCPSYLAQGYVSGITKKVCELIAG